MAQEPSAHDALRESTGLYALGALTPEEQAAFEAHLVTCAECAAEVRAFSTVAGALAQAAPQVNPSASLRERTLAAAGLAGGPGLGPGPAGARSASAAGWSARTPWLAFAASVSLAVGLGVYVLQLRERITTLEARLREAVLRAEAGERQFADARRVLADAQSRIAVMAAPDVARVDLAGRAAAPSAAARVFWSRSRGLLFTGSNMPPVPPGRVYQVWFISGQTPVSAGLIVPGVGGQLDAILDVPVGIQAPAVMAVSVEPAGGVPAPTSEPFLVGPVRGS
jgi:anti-sigma-K factor RskA